MLRSKRARLMAEVARSNTVSINYEIFNTINVKLK